MPCLFFCYLRRNLKCVVFEDLNETSVLLKFILYIVCKYHQLNCYYYMKYKCVVNFSPVLLINLFIRLFTVNLTLFTVDEISFSYDEYEGGCLPECCTVWSGRH
jgi:hypothetical protein